MKKMSLDPGGCSLPMGKIDAIGNTLCIVRRSCPAQGFLIKCCAPFDEQACQEFLPDQNTCFVIDTMNIFSGIRLQKPPSLWPIAFEQRPGRQIITEQTPHFCHMFL